MKTKTSIHSDIPDHMNIANQYEKANVASSDDDKAGKLSLLPLCALDVNTPATQELNTEEPMKLARITEEMVACKVMYVKMAKSPIPDRNHP